ncbi:MAG: DUF3881 family protein, partial [Blastocatellia bacterium]|nr:DUF3881 family protein [Blastocatellia bacterium]
ICGQKTNGRKRTYERPRDYATTRLRDHAITRPRDYATTRLRDHAPLPGQSRIMKVDMPYPITHPSYESEPFGGTVMAELFEAIGFEVRDEDSYNRLAEYAETSGERSLMHREDTTLHGRCWKLGGGLEVWSMLYEREGELFYADCRPAFRSRYVRPIRDWELIEYVEDGEAILKGCTQQGRSIVFELQNLTEADPSTFRRPQLEVALAGLAYCAQARPAPLKGRRKGGLSYRFDLAERLPEYEEDACENDYAISGKLLAWREIKNPVSASDLVWIHVDVGEIYLEVLVNRRALSGRLDIGCRITANIWLQGHLLETDEITTRYEGVDPGYETSDFWARLRRGN